MVWVALIVAILAVVLAYTAGAKAPEPIAQSLKDVQAPTAEQGRPIPVVFGTCVLKSANLVWFGDLRIIPIRDKPKK